MALHTSSSSPDFPWPTIPSSTYKTLSPPSSHRIVASRAPHKSLCVHTFLYRSHEQFLCCSSQEADCSTGFEVDPIILEKIRAMNKYNKRRRQHQLPTLSICIVATFVICLLLTSPSWFPRLCSLLSFFFLTTLPNLLTAFLLSPKCLFIVGNLIIAFLVGESRLAPRRDNQPSLVNEIHEEHVKKNTAMVAKATTAAVVMADDSAFIAGMREEVEVKEEEGEEDLHKRVEDFIARVKKQRKLEAKSFFDVDR